MAFGVKTTNVFELLGDSEGGEDAPVEIKAPESKKKEAPGKAADSTKADAAGQSHNNNSRRLQAAFNWSH